MSDNDNSSVLVLNNVHKTYLLGLEGVPALRGVNLKVEKGEFICILGSSGGGKSSLLNLIGTIDRPTKGDITICGHRLSSNSLDSELAKLRLRHIGFVFQTFNLIPSMTALENVSLPMILKGGLSSSEIEKRAIYLLKRVGLGSRLHHTPSMLSGGEQQRVTIARAISNKPDLLLLDEPTGDLDTKNSVLILSLLLALNRVDGITCIMVTHDQSLKFHAHRVVHMMDGKILRIENIPNHLRQAHYETLNKNKHRAINNPTMALDAFDNNSAKGNNHNNSDTSISTTTNNNNNLFDDSSFTEIRDPEKHYPNFIIKDHAHYSIS